MSDPYQIGDVIEARSEYFENSKGITRIVERASGGLRTFNGSARVFIMEDDILRNFTREIRDLESLDTHQGGF